MTRRFLTFSIVSLFLISNYGCAKRWDVLSRQERIVLRRILGHWQTWVPKRKKEGSAPLMAFDELYSGLKPEEQSFLDRVRRINPRRSFDFRGNFFGMPGEDVKFKRIEDQRYNRDGKSEKLDPQYLPEEVYIAYEAMMEVMEKDLGKRLLVESGFRSPAYQLYTFLTFLPKHHYSLAETGHWVALPGYSEHGAPQRQAIDFMNQQGINGEDNVEEFAELPEYEWLLHRAGEFGFELSYPRGKKGITFEPWHWRYVKG